MLSVWGAEPSAQEEGPAPDTMAGECAGRAWTVLCVLWIYCPLIKPLTCLVSALGTKFPPANTVVLSPGWSRPFTGTVVFQTLFEVVWSRPYHTHPTLEREETEDKGVK